METDILVDSADQAAAAIGEAGGRVIVRPFDVPIGRCTVVDDPWGNRLVLLDMSKASLVTAASSVVLTNPDGTPCVAGPSG